MSFALNFKRRMLFFILFLLSLLLKLDASQCPTGSFPDTSHQEKKHWVVFADLLVWLASEEVSSIWADVITIDSNSSSWKALSFAFNWDYGFRIGAGYGIAYDQWDTALYWTRFCTNAKHMISHNPDTRITPEFFAAFLSSNIPQSMNVKWNFVFNMFDWELGRKYWISKCLYLRPFLGLKGGWINQSIQGQYYNLTIDNIQTSESGRENLKNNFWGIGTMGGINTKWRFSNFWSYFPGFFGDFSIATLWGRWVNEDVYKNTVSQISSVNMKNSTLGALMFRGFAGIEWNIKFNSGKSCFSTKLGYEMQLWLNQLRLATFQLQRLHGDLSLQGITFNCRFDF